jgi:pimeloyl-ACP methyl ester carboxylesterase
MRFELEAGDARLVGDEVGYGPVFVLLHAGAERRQVWDPVVEELVAAGYACVTLDQRGHGESTGSRNASFDCFAADIAALCARVGRRAVCVGSSLGGLSLLGMASADANAVESGLAALVLVDVVPDPNPEGTRVLLTQLLGASTAQSPIVLDILSRAEPLREAARRLTLPLLLVRGERGVREEDAARFTELVPHAQQAVVANAGHLVARDQPQALARVLLDFVARDAVHARWDARRVSTARTRAEAWLTARAAASLEHVAGMLHPHLRRTALWLERWQAPEHVQLAGLCHAAYGTDGFATALDTDREPLRAAIGVRAEQLVHDYCVCDRAHFAAQLGGSDLRLRDRVRGEERALEPDEVSELVLLTLANELDVALHSADAALHAAIVALFQQLAHHRPAEAAVALRLLTHSR